MEKTIKIIVNSIIIGFLVLSLIFGGFYHVSEQKNAVVTMFGKVIRVDTAGLHFKIPYIQKMKKVDITTHGVGIGYVISDDGQNIDVADTGVMITSDFNLLNIDFYLEYKVNDPVAYLYNSEDAEDIFVNIALSAIRSTIVNYTVDEAMTTEKARIQSDIKEAMISDLEKYNVGISVVNIQVQDSEPPTEAVKAAFENVETKKQMAEQDKNNALKERNEKIPEAEANADKIIRDAEATKEARIAEAEGEVANLNATYEQYKLNPLITKKRMFYETIEEVLPELKVIITDGTTETMLPLENFAEWGE